MNKDKLNISLNEDIFSFNNVSIYNFPRKVWHIFSPNRKKQIWLCLSLMFISAISDFISISSTLPFLYVLTEPEKIWGNKFIRESALFFFNISGPDELFIPITIFFLLVATISGLIRLFNLKINTKLAATIGSDISEEVYKRVLHQPYSFHIDEKKSKIKIALVQYLEDLMRWLNDYLNLIWSSLSMLLIVTALIFTNWIIVFSTFLSFALIYIYLSKSLQRRISKNSFMVAEAKKTELKLLDEGLGSIRDIIIDGIQNTYLREYSKVDSTMRMQLAENYFLSTFPRYALESISLVIIALLSLIFTIILSDPKSIIPLLGTIALCLQRLVPTLQRIYSSWASLNNYWGSVKNIYYLLNLEFNNLNTNSPSNESKEFNKDIVFKDVCFKYRNKKQNVIKNINLTIPSGSCIGIIGKTGGGKSTFLDLLMGLLEPTSGKILVDDKDLSSEDNLRNWRNLISHVPQDIYLSDCSFSENIAIGKTRDQIDYERIKYAAKVADIHDFILSTEQGYKTKVGELGIGLSGGQKQRVGIARAIYKSCNVLILDEATSSLDTETETNVVNSIQSNCANLTLIIVAHNLNTLRNCERIILLKDGKIEKEGPPEKVLNKYSFK